jgi:DNA-binding transcriptional regulator PaaX
VGGERIELTEQDLIEAILTAQAAAAGGDAGALTIRELVERTGLSTDRVRTKLHGLQNAGRLEVCRVLRMTLDERTQLVPAYRLKT